jgi:integrase
MINSHVELQHAIGLKYITQNYLLQSFATFAQGKGDTYVRCKTVLEWAIQAQSSTQRRNRLLAIRRFAIAMHAEDKRNEIPPSDVFGRKIFKRRVYKILSDGELKCLLIATSKLKSRSALRPKTYITLFTLLAVTGLRISEALALNLEDITDDGLIVRATKFRKDRLVPIHESTRQGIQHYLNDRSRYNNIDRALFISSRGTRLSYSSVIGIFLKLTRSIGLRDRSARSGVRIHDFRHRFAMKSLEQCCASNYTAVLQHMTALSTYLGHTHITDTYCYLHATPILTKQIAIAQENFFMRRKNHD